jgi:uncharacterized membrane protein YcaP (DUF421 family)
VDLVVRAVVVFLFIWVVTRVVGRRELSSMEPFDVILLVVIGDLVQQGITQSDYSVTGTILVVSTVALLTIAMSWLSYRVPRLRPVLEGEPLVLLQDGEPIRRNLRRQRLTMDELLGEARQQQIADLSEVRFAVLETNGRISFVR